MTELAALNVKINGDSADLQSDIAKAKAQLQGFDTQVNKAQAGTTRFSGGLSRLGNVSGSTRAKIQNTSFQLQDIAVQLSAGTRASTVFAQQLPQLAGGFGPVGSAVGALAAVGIPALAFAFGDLGNKAETLEDTMVRLRDTVDSYAEAASLARMSTEELRERFGAAAEGMRSTLNLLEQIERSQAQKVIDGIGQSISDLMGIAGSGEARAGIADFFDVNIFFAVTDAQREAREEARLLTSEFLNQQRALKNANGDLDQQIVAMQGLISSAQKLANLKGGISQAEEDLIKKLAETLLLMQEQRGKVEEVHGAAFNLVDAYAAANAAAAAGSPILSGLLAQVQNLATAAWNFADGLGTASTKFGALRDLSTEYQVAATRAGIESGAIPGIAAADLPPPPGMPEGGGGIALLSGDAGTGSGTSGAGAAANPIVAQLEQLQNALMTQEEMQIASFERQQETLKSALEQRLLTQQEYNALMQDAETQHSYAMAQIKQKEYSMVSSAQSAMYSELGNLFGVFAQKSKAAAVAQIAINKALSIAQIIQNTAVAQMRALAELGPIAGPPVAAKIGLYGKIQAGIAAATGFAQAFGAASGGGGSAAGGAVGAAAGAAAGAAPAAPAVSRNVAISLQGGDMFSRDQVIKLINAINESVEDGAIVRLV